MYDQIEPLLAQIKEAPAAGLADLRAKALVCLYESRPQLADDLEFQWPDDGGAAKSLVSAILELTDGPGLPEFEKLVAATEAEV